MVGALLVVLAAVIMNIGVHATLHVSIRTSSSDEWIGTSQEDGP